MKVRNNVASLNSLRHANENFNRVSDSVEKLSSGMKINKAKDAPANLIASERFRGKIAGLKQSHSNNEMAMTIYQQAEGSLNEISDILVRLKQISVHAANEAVNDDAMLAADQEEAENLLGTITRIVQNTVYNGKTLLDGSQGANGTTVGDNLRFVTADVNTNGSPEEGFPVDITQVATRAQKPGQIPLTVNNIGDGLFVLVSEGGRSAELDTRRGQLKEDIDDILKSFNENPERFPAEKMSEDIRGMVVYHMQKTIDETNRRRKKQIEHNKTFNITPTQITKSKQEIIEQTSVADMGKEGPKPYIKPTGLSLAADPVLKYMSQDELKKNIKKTKKEMIKAAKELNFLEAARLRDEIQELEKLQK